MENEHETERENQLQEDVSALTDCGGNLMPNNVTGTRPSHDQAQARVLVSGLSIFGFNPAGARAEFGFIKPMHTDLRMDIYERSMRLPVWSTASSQNFPFPNTKDITININSTGTGIGQRFEVNPLIDPEDFRRMPGFRYWHGQRLSFKPGAKAHLTARINVMNGIFYTYQLSKSIALEHKKRKPNGPVQFNNRGVIGRIMGADIFSDEPELVIDLRIHNQTHQVKLPNGQGTQYTIVLTTVATGTGHGHLKHVYDNVLDNPDLYQYDLEFYPHETPWRYRIFGNKTNGFYYTDFSEELSGLSNDDVEIFESTEQAEAKDYKPAENPGIMSTQYACECYEGNCPPQPEIP